MRAFVVVPNSKGLGYKKKKNGYKDIRHHQMQWDIYSMELHFVSVHCWC